VHGSIFSALDRLMAWYIAWSVSVNIVLSLKLQLAQLGDRLTPNIDLKHMPVCGGGAIFAACVNDLKLILSVSIRLEATVCRLCDDWVDCCYEGDGDVVSWVRVIISSSIKTAYMSTQTVISSRSFVFKFPDNERSSKLLSSSSNDNNLSTSWADCRVCFCGVEGA